MIEKEKRALSEEARVLMIGFFMNRPLLAKLLVVCLLFLTAQDLPAGWMSCSVQRRPTHCGGRDRCARGLGCHAVVLWLPLVAARWGLVLVMMRMMIFVLLLPLEGPSSSRLCDGGV